MLYCSALPLLGYLVLRNQSGFAGWSYITRTLTIDHPSTPLAHCGGYLHKVVFSRYGTQSGSTHSDTHTHNIRCSTSVIVPRPSGFCPSHGAPLAGLSPKVCFGVTKVLYPRHPSPHFSPPRNQLAQAARAWWHPQYPPQWREQYGRHGLRAWLDHAHGRRIAGFPPHPLGVRVRDRHMQKAGCGREQLP